MKEILITLCLLHQLSPGAADHCSWFVDTVKWDEPLQKSTTVGNTIESINTTSKILGIDIPNLLIYPPKEGYHSYPYFLRAKIACNHLEISQEHGRSLALSGVRPVFILRIKRDDDTTCSVVSQLRMEGILIDKANGTDVNCSSTICSPVWLAPLPVGPNMLLMPVIVDVEGLGCEWSSARHVIHLDSFVTSSPSEPGSLINALGEKADFNELEDVLSETKAYPNKFILELSPVEVISGFGNNLMLYSSDDFLNITLLRLQPLNRSPVCPSSHFTSPDEIFDTVTLSDSVLISTTVGVIQEMGKFKSVEMGPKLVFNKSCVKEIIIPKQHIPKVHYVFLRTTDHKVYMKDQVSDLSGLCLSFSEVNDTGRGVCDITNDTYCQVVSLDVLPTGLVNGLILLETGDTPDLTDYKLLHFRDGNITLLYTIPKDVMINPAHANHVLLEESKLVNSEQEAISKMVNIQGISTTAHISIEIYLWGSHLVQSFDGGNAFILMSGYNSDGNITLFTSSLDGHFVLLNDKQEEVSSPALPFSLSFSTQEEEEEEEIWIGLTASWFITRIYPSISWSAYMLTNRIDLSNKEIKTLSLFFDSNNEVSQLLGYTDDEGNVQVKHMKIPAVEILSNIIFEDVIHKDPRKLQNEIAAESADYSHFSEENACPFHSILFTMPHSIMGFTAKEVFLFGPPRQFHGYGQSDNALKGTLVHQAAVHLLLTKEHAQDRMYLDDFNSHTAKWKAEIEKDKGQEADTDFKFTNGLLKDGIHLHIEEYMKEFVPQNDVLIHLPELIYLDKNVTFHFTIEVHLSSDEHIMEHESGVHSVEDSQISVKIANSSLLTVSNNRQEHHQTEMVVFEYDIAASDTLSIQSLPGRDLLTSCVNFHVEDSLLKCVQQESSGREVGFQVGVDKDILTCDLTASRESWPPS
ncbi:cation channel sperm-associated auxiliary subunit gamma-like [Lineus longissimus]|uniref:cation channel sperm-associated auxiliary subunit gamma-like n=1 Tax=Lineus longissimus TaxID=88925 RepID=UPI00315D3D29